MQFRRLFFMITFLLNFLLVSFAQEPMLLEHGGGVRTVEFSPVDASLVASAGESNIIKLWNLRNNTAVLLRGHTSRINSVAFSPNGELLASVSDDRTIRLWNIQSQQNTATRNITDRYQSIAFSSDGQTLATGGGKHVKLWNARNQTEIATLQHNQDVRTVAFSPDGQLLAAGDGSGDGPGTVNVWNIQRRQVVISLEANPKNVKAVEFSSDNRYLASSGWNGYLKVWDISNWELQHTIPNVGHYDIAFSPDGKMLASTGNGYVGLWWVEDGANVAQLKGPTDWIHPVDFSHDGTFLAVGAEDGIVRIWRINASLANDNNGGIRILHVDAYLQQLPNANSAKIGNIPEPVPPPAIVRDFFELDPFYQQWINVEGLPVIASVKVNPYAVKEAAWLILKMIGHRPDVLRAMVGNKVRFVVIGYTEMTTQIPEYSDLRPAFYYDRRVRGLAGHPAVSCTEENLLDYPGDTAPNGYQLIHEFSHIVHLTGLRAIDPGFDNRLKMMYNASMKKGLWRGTYAASDRYEYWAEGTNAWIDPKGGSSFKGIHGGNTRAELKTYDPGLATLLTEVYGDGEWRYTPVVTRTHLPHLQGFNPQDSPTFKWPKELEETYAQLRDPDINGGNEWMNLNSYKPSQLSHLNKARTRGALTYVLFVNLAEIDVLVYQVHPDGAEIFIKRVPANRGLRHAEKFNSHVGDVYLIKDQKGRNLAVFRAEEQTGRALIGTLANKASHAAREDVSRNDSQPRVLIAQSQRPPMYWVDPEAGTLHRLVGAKVETLVPSVQNATSLAVDMVVEKLYWTGKTSDRTGTIRRANLDGTDMQLVKSLTSVPHSIAIDTTNDILYLTNAWGKIQRLNLDGSNFQPNFIIGLEVPKHITLDIARGKIYWTEGKNRIRRANLDGSNIQTLFADLGTIGGIAIAEDKLYWTEQTGESAGKVQRANLDDTNIQTLISLQSIPLGIAVDATGRKLYWTNSRGKIQRADLNGSSVQNLVADLNSPTGITLGIARDDVVVTETSLEKITGPWLWMIAPTEAGQGGAKSNNVDSLAAASGGSVTEADVAANGAREGDAVGNYVWTFGEIAETGGNNVNDLLNKIGLGRGDVDDHSSYALITLESAIAQSGVTMRTGSDDAIKIWLNGKVVHNNSIDRGAEDYQDRFKVDLKQGDNLLLVKVSERRGWWSMFVGIDADVNAVYKRPPAPVVSSDVNGDGIVNILDLVSVSVNFGKTGQSPADVNGDGIVNIIDLVKVAGEMGAGAAAPSAHPQTLEILTAADVQHWLTQAQHLGLTDATSQRGILRLQLLLAALIPKETSLLPNYPNPFNPETWIPYHLAKPAEVTLYIYGVDGSLIWRLTLGHQPAGMYHSKSRAVYWDGKNEAGEAVASGIYFYTFSAGDFTSTRKMLILK